MIPETISETVSQTVKKLEIEQIETEIRDGVKETVSRTENAYRSALKDYGAVDQPVGSYVKLIGSYSLFFGTLFLLATRNGRPLRKPNGRQLTLLTIASYKLSRIVTMSFIGSPIRAPFAKRGQSLKGGEVQDEARGEGIQKAIGNLVTCPFCFNVWSTTLFVFGFSIVPRITQQLSTILTIAAGGDILHHGYRSLREVSK